MSLVKLAKRINCHSSASSSLLFKSLASGHSTALQQVRPFSSNNDGSFLFRDLQIQLSPISKPKPDPQSIAFGQLFTDHMLEVEWSAKGWSTPKISPLHNFTLHPSAKVLHYANTLFEGLKAFRGVDNKVRLIRPEMNMKRMLSSARRLAFPTFDPNELLNCLKKLVTIDADWVLPAETNCSLYIRPTMIATEASLGVATGSSGLLYVILSPVGSYFGTGSEIKPVVLMADPKYVRAWPGGTGDSKLGSNYGPTCMIQQKIAAQLGCSQILWLFGPEEKLTEAGTMNVFVAIKNPKDPNVIDLFTPPIADGLILPGVNRDSIIKLTQSWPGINLVERAVTMKEVLLALENGSLVEIFGAGTACVVSPIGGIHYNGRQIDIPTSSDGLTARIYKAMTDIFYARVQHEWNEQVIC